MSNNNGEKLITPTQNSSLPTQTLSVAAVVTALGWRKVPLETSWVKKTFQHLEQLELMEYRTKKDRLGMKTKKKMFQFKWY